VKLDASKTPNEIDVVSDGSTRKGVGRVRPHA